MAQVYTEKHATDSHETRDRRIVQHLSPNPSGTARDFVEWRDRRTGVHVTDADVSMTLWSGATDMRVFARQTLTLASIGLVLRRRAALRCDRRGTASVGLPSDASVDLEHGLELSIPCLSQRQTLVVSASDASDAGSRSLDFERVVDTWKCLRATDARVTSIGLATDTSVAPEICPVNC
jgi:hypothetical protein